MLLLTVPDPILSSYDFRGRTMTPEGRPLSRAQLVPVAKRTGSSLATPGTIRAMLAADAALHDAGGEGLRVTEASRPWSVQERGRVAYETWVTGGRPDPGGVGWRNGMRNVYMCRPGESQHGWGGANDWHVYVMAVAAGVRPGTNEALSALWDIVRPLGWRPIIREPRIGLSECWHFDHFGPLERVRQAFLAHRSDARYRDTYALTAVAGHALVGTWQGEHPRERYVQALLLLGGEFPGLVDGAIGPATRTAFERLAGRPWPAGPTRGDGLLGTVVEATNLLHEVEPVRAALASL